MPHTPYFSHRPLISAQSLPCGYIIPSDPDDRCDIPKLLAEMFCSLNSEYQAVFFDRIAEIDEGDWERHGIFQWRAMQGDLTGRAKRVIDDIKNHTDPAE
jgi:hypothetical protein